MMNETGKEMNSKDLTFYSSTRGAHGTGFMGYVQASYADLVRIFGEPTDGDGDKTDAQWVLRFADDQVATIYNYKNGKTYLGADGLDKTEIETWHVGGKSKIALSRIQKILELNLASA